MHALQKKYKVDKLGLFLLLTVCSLPIRLFRAGRRNVTHSSYVPSNDLADLTAVTGAETKFLDVPIKQLETWRVHIQWEESEALFRPNSFTQEDSFFDNMNF